MWLLFSFLMISCFLPQPVFDRPSSLFSLLPVVNVRIGAFQGHQHLTHSTLLVDGHVVEVRRSGGSLNFTNFLAAATLDLELGLDEVVSFPGRVDCRLSSNGLKRSSIGETSLSRPFFGDVYKLISKGCAKNRGWTLYRWTPCSRL
jgi:hypothetical protein